MELEGSSPQSQETATCPYPEPDLSSPCSQSNLSKTHFNIILPSTPGSIKWSHTYTMNKNRIQELHSFRGSNGRVKCS